MLSRIESRQKRESAAHKHADNEAGQEAELRQQMYERIARGNALAEAEEHARRKWLGK